MPNILKVSNILVRKFYSILTQKSNRNPSTIYICAENHQNLHNQFLNAVVSVTVSAGAGTGSASVRETERVGSGKETGGAREIEGAIDCVEELIV